MCRNAKRDFLAIKLVPGQSREQKTYKRSCPRFLIIIYDMVRNALNNGAILLSGHADGAYYSNDRDARSYVYIAKDYALEDATKIVQALEP